MGSWGLRPQTLAQTGKRRLWEMELCMDAYTVTRTSASACTAIFCNVGYALTTSS
jgi:hypothetical protein